MKTKLFFFLVILFAMSCEQKRELPISIISSNSDTINLYKYPKPFLNFFNSGEISNSYVLEIDAAGHEYITNGGYHSLIFMHNPECPVCIKRYNTLIKLLGKNNRHDSN